MDDVWVALLSVMGTLAAVLVTAHVQRRASRDAELRDERRRLADRRAEAMADFARNLIDYRRAELQRWFEVENARKHGERLDPDAAGAGELVRTTRSTSWGEFYRLRLLWDDDEILGNARDLLSRISELEHIRGKEQVKLLANAIRDDLAKLTDRARERLAPARFHTRR